MLSFCGKAASLARQGARVKKNISNALFAVVVFGVLCPSPAYAYLDGATISLILQAVTGAIASALLFGKIYWNKLVRLFSRKPSATGHDQQD
jgi:hypothetical protein